MENDLGMAFVVFPPIIHEIREKVGLSLDTIPNLKEREVAAGLVTIILDLIAKMPFETQSDLMNGTLKDFVAMVFSANEIHIEPLTNDRKEMN